MDDSVAESIELEKAAKPKSPWFAVVLAFMITGLGHFYARRFKRGIGFIVFEFLATIAIFCIISIPDLKFTMGLVSLSSIISILYLVWYLRDTYSCTKSYNEVNQLKYSRSIKRFSLSLIAFMVVLGMKCFYITPGLAVALFVKHNYLEAFHIPDFNYPQKYSILKPEPYEGAMFPCIKPDDRLLVNKIAYQNQIPAMGDLVVFKYPVNPIDSYVMRVVGLPGQKLEIKDQQVWVDGQPLIEPPFDTIQYDYTRIHYDIKYGKSGQRFTVPPNHLFVLGDNAGKSNDSTVWGFLPLENVTGKAFKIYWPPERSGPLY